MTALLLALQLTVPAGLDAYIPAPETNPITRAMATLGKRLFFDTALSRDRTVSCGSCHNPDHSFTDPHPRAIGLGGRKGPRRTPTIVNRGYGKAFFWDGRAPTLEHQVLQPIQNPDEMGMTIDEVLARIPGLTRETLSHALASYVRTILAGNSPYDRFLQGDKAALTAQQIAGLKLFRGKANCVACHVGMNLTDEQFHNTGAGSLPDEGRFAVTKREPDRGAFKTPTLRQIAVRPPYMHDGSVATLEQVIDFYDKGEQKPHIDPEIRPLRLSADEKAALAAFLRSLTGVVKDGYE